VIMPERSHGLCEKTRGPRRKPTAVLSAPTYEVLPGL
jgi:hypothetical protein